MLANVEVRGWYVTSCVHQDSCVVSIRTVYSLITADYEYRRHACLIGCWGRRHSSFSSSLLGMRAPPCLQSPAKPLINSYISSISVLQPFHQAASSNSSCVNTHLTGSLETRNFENIYLMDLLGLFSSARLFEVLHDAMDDMRLSLTFWTVFKIISAGFPFWLCSTIAHPSLSIISLNKASLLRKIVNNMCDNMP